MEINSRDNSRIKEYRHLQASSRYRRERGRVALEGVRLCLDALRSGCVPESVLITASARRSYPDAVAALAAVAEVFDIPDALGEYLADTSSPQGLFAVVPVQSVLRDPETADPHGRYAAAEEIRDPGNLGTMIRTAEAFGLDGLLLSEGCCDPFSPKALRSSMGGVFRLPLYAAGRFSEQIPRLRERGLRCAACVVDAAAEPVPSAALDRPGTVVLIGNEGNGLHPETVAVCDTAVTLPMAGRAESLNASMAAGILFWEMTRQGGTDRG